MPSIQSWHPCKHTAHTLLTQIPAGAPDALALGKTRSLDGMGAGQSKLALSHPIPGSTSISLWLVVG
jgi:hypothetical protein